VTWYAGAFWFVTMIFVACFIVFVTVEAYETYHDWKIRRQYQKRS
jgi:type II secretory pathway component PulL